MDNKLRFRNHISVLLEDIGKAGWAILVALFMGVGEVFTEEEVVEDATTLVETTEDALITAAIFGGIAILVIGSIILRILIWSKTWITIEEQAITIECNTILRQKKNTIGIKNISNINLEQNLIEMLFGTAKLKLDTNSLTTANATDVRLILKKPFAEEMKQLLLMRMNQIEKGEFVVEQQGVKEEQEQKEAVLAPYFKATTGDIIKHGFLSSGIVGSVFGLVILAALIISGMAFMAEDIEELLNAGFLALVWVAILVIGYVWKYIQAFIRYLDFTIRREDDRLIIHYGIIKKVDYSIPVNKIQALKLRQTGIGRILKSGMLEVINVGMNDGDAQEQCFLLPYYKKEKLHYIVKALLPEFAECLECKEERQPKSIWFVWIWSIFIYLIVVAVGMCAVIEFVPEMRIFAMIGVVVVSIILILWKWGTYLTKGSHFEGTHLMLVTGCVGKQIVFVKYDKIQYVTVKQSFLAKRCGIVKGEIHLLASLANQTHSIPYFKKQQVEVLKENIL